MVVGSEEGGGVEARVESHGHFPIVSFLTFESSVPFAWSMLPDKPNHEEEQNVHDEHQKLSLEGKLLAYNRNPREEL